MAQQPDPQTMLGEADQVQARIRRGSRWYPAWVAVFGVVSVGIVAWVPVLHGWWAIAFIAVLLGWIFGLERWKAGMTVRPVSDRMALARWLVPWVVLYLLVVSWVGPRWLDQHVGWWALMGVVVSAPAFVEAIRYAIRLRS